MKDQSDAMTVLDPSDEPAERCPCRGHGGPEAAEEVPDTRARALSWQLNDDGRATAMTLLSRMQCWGARWLRLLMWFFRRFPILTELRRLSFIHFAHWSALDGLAAPGSGASGRKPDKYLLFESNFNGPWHEYIEAFCHVVGNGIKAILAPCEGFPGLTPVRAFKPYMEHHEFVVDHYYAAYPQASATMVRSAFELASHVTVLRRLAARADDAGFAQAWDRLLRDPRAQSNLAGQACALPGWWAYLRQGALARKNTAGNAYVFIALTPIAPGRADRLRAHLRGMPRHRGDRCRCQSPLAEAPGTHFGRWVVLDRVYHDGWPEQFETLDPAYLLFTAVFDIAARDAVGSYLDGLLKALGDNADAIWGTCQGWPRTGDPAARSSYLRHHQRDAHFLFAAYPGSVSDVRQALADRELLRSFAQRAQALPPDRLRAAFADHLANPEPPAGRGGAR